MKKTFLFASFIAIVAMLAVSCKPKGDLPSPRFGYEADALTVVFTNLSKGAESYAWDFGDGETSIEEAPTHVYKEYGEYTVVLKAKNAVGEKSYSEDIALTKKIIILDGDFTDWVECDAKAAKCVADDNAKEDYFYAAKFIRDEEFVYFFLEFDGAKDDFTTEEGDVHDYWVKHVSLWLDFGDATGCNIWWWAPTSWVDFLIEGSWEDKFESATIDQCPEDLNGGDNSEWLWVSTGVTGAVSSCEAQTLQNGHLAIEGKIMVALLPLQPENIVRMGIGALAPDWENYAGRLPQTTITAGGTEEQGALVEVPLVK